MTRDIATAARELLALIDTVDRTLGYEIREAADVMREALAHHETHRSREIHPLTPSERESAEAMHNGLRVLIRDKLRPDEEHMARAAYQTWEDAHRINIPAVLMAAPDPHHEADAALRAKTLEDAGNVLAAAGRGEARFGVGAKMMTEEEAYKWAAERLYIMADAERRTNTTAAAPARLLVEALREALAQHETHRDGIDMGHGESWSVEVLRCRWCAYTFEPHQGAEFAEHVKERHPQWAAPDPHHETHRSREVHPLAAAYLEAIVEAESYDTVNMRRTRQAWYAAGRPIYAAPDPHHEADAVLSPAARYDLCLAEMDKLWWQMTPEERGQQNEAAKREHADEALLARAAVEVCRLHDVIDAGCANGSYCELCRPFRALAAAPDRREKT